MQGTQSTMWVELNTDGSVTQRGFNASFSCQDKPGIPHIWPSCVEECVSTCGVGAPPGFEDRTTAFSDSSGCSFAFFDEPRTNAEAEAACVESGGHLVSLHSERDQHALQEIVPHHATVWIGFTDTATEGTLPSAVSCGRIPARALDRHPGRQRGWGGGRKSRDCGPAPRIRAAPRSRCLGGQPLRRSAPSFGGARPVAAATPPS